MICEYQKLPQGYIFSSWIINDLRWSCTTLWQDAIHLFFPKKKCDFHFMAFVFLGLHRSCFWGVQSFPIVSDCIVCLFFSDWVTSLRMIFSRCIYLLRYFIKWLFLIAEKYSLCKYITIYVFIHLLTDIWVLSSFWLL